MAYENKRSRIFINPFAWKICDRVPSKYFSRRVSKTHLRIQPGERKMKKQFIILLSLFVAPLAFAQTTAADKTNSSVAYTDVKSNNVATVSAYEPGKSITVNSTTVTHPVKYVVAPDVQYMKKDGGGEITPDLLKPGSRVELDFDAAGQVNRISLIELH
jgi:hypothetical protein